MRLLYAKNVDIQTPHMMKRLLQIIIILIKPSTFHVASSLPASGLQENVEHPQAFPSGFFQRWWSSSGSLDRDVAVVSLPWSAAPKKES